MSSRFEIAKGKSYSLKDLRRDYQDVCSKIKCIKQPYVNGDSYEDLSKKIIIFLNNRDIKLEEHRDRIKEEIDYAERKNSDTVPVRVHTPTE